MSSEGSDNGGAPRPAAADGPKGPGDPSGEAAGHTVPGAAEPEDAAARVGRLEQEKKDLHDRLLRTAAEFDNWKKRAKKESDEAQARGREGLLKELLPVLDNLERALKHAPEGDPLAAGVRLVEKQLLQALERFSVTRFSALGQPFDPALHEAIQQVETEKVAPGAVAEEFASGYMQGTRLLRPAMVAVAKPPGPTATPTAADG
jgi:molecular chaperone GrpE